MVTLLMIAGISAIGTYMYIRATSYIPFMQTLIDQQKAKVLALGGLQLAISKLVYTPEAPKEQAAKSATAAPAADDANRQLYVSIMPALNRWQIFELRAHPDGMDGIMKICIMSEDGKLDINQVYDFKKKQFKGQGTPQGDMKKIMELVCKKIESATGMRDLLPALETFLKKRGYPLNDVTELVTISSWAPFSQKIFYEPRTETKPSEKPVLYLTDIFTLFSGKITLEPRLFSDSWLGIASIAQAYQGQVKERSELIKKIGKQFKQSVQWKADWNTQLKPIYQKELQSLPKGLDSVLDTTFDPRFFMIRVDATCGSVTQRLVAIVERERRMQAGRVVFEGIIKKMYWL